MDTRALAHVTRQDRAASSFGRDTTKQSISSVPFARKHAVDAWYTCDHTHFALVARHRRPAQQRSRQEFRI
jgi:hypothetical protein